MRTTTKIPSLRMVSVALAAGAVLALGTAPLRATSAPQSTPSAKATAAISQTQLVNATTAAGWNTILSNTLKTSNKKDIFVNVALEAGLMTRTLTQSKGGNKSTSTAEAEVGVRVMVDGLEAYPGEIVLASRKQELSAKLDGLISSCFFIDENGNVVLDEECVEPEEIELVLSTMSAHAFNFIYPDCGPGVHTFEVQTRVKTSTDATTGTGSESSAFAMVGRGSASVEEVRFANNEDIELP